MNHTDNPIISAVTSKLNAQQEKGLAKYGQPVQVSAYDLRGWLQHALEETLDHAVYLEAAIQTIEGGRTMKFYEINEPYYALLKAKDEADAERIYNEQIADTDDYENFQDDEIIEVERDYALIMFSRTKDEDGKLVSYTRISEDFNNPEIEVLIMDGSLL
ncbi:hypothetical protein [Bacillus subtilis]|uniref:hypothetical protein n=1 Tax=Bacillus subtilis TaxID=1423 RepID=UPI00240DE092|nr:hypothetical protein [Bacillus subtilis]WFA91215.1 hypothetical protein LFL98_16065 [Bacillus subtilis]